MSEKQSLTGKPRVLILCSYYLPGYQGGGGLRTLVHMVERFRDRYDFRVITSDGDVDKIPYTSVKINEWNEVEGAQVFYLSKDNINISKLRELILEVKPDSVYLNSVFAVFTIYYLTLRKLKLIPFLKTVLAPEGELAEDALKFRAYKKIPYIKLAKKTGLFRDLIWKTTAAAEQTAAEKIKGRGGKMFVAPNLPSLKLLQNYRREAKPKKIVGAVKMVHLARYMRIKNLKWLIDNLKDFEGDLTIDVFGPIEDAGYWRETEKAIAALPSNVKVEYRGRLEYEKVSEMLAAYHFFVLPSLGENFGHVFIEALAAGCPLVISDRTPWRNLNEKKIGWDLPLEEPIKWLEALTYCLNLDEANYRVLSDNARKFAEQWLADPKIEEDTLNVLRYSLKN